jgi:hypothetical protein
MKAEGMHPTKEEFEESYRHLSEEDISGLYAQNDTLTDDARSALAEEMQWRGLSGAQLTKMHAADVRHEAQFDRLERFRRKKLAVGSLNDLQGWGIAILVVVVYVLVRSLIAHRH